ncbi:MAG: VOC family protein [Chloroflexota bacterium]|nr:VOC family protein [Dehalococcoidia bacterium]MDW8252923.1 VOC family protein [Chloroflexota bacterium]
MIGWFVRRTPALEQTAAFYREVVGLPLLRTEGETQLFWAGESMIFAVGAGGTLPPPYTDRAETTCIPVFRCLDLASVLARILAAGRPILNDRQLIHGRLVYIVDPSGNVTGFQERSRTSPRPEDREAFRRLERGAPLLPGVSPLPPDLYGLGWVVSWFQDEARAIRFYRDVVGLPDSGNTVHGGGALLSLGPTVLLDAKGGGRVQPAAADRFAANNLFILRVDDLDREVDRLRAHGVRFVHDPFQTDEGTFAYFADPEGQLVGLHAPHTPRAGGERVAAGI